LPEPTPTPPAWLADPARADDLLNRLAARLTPHRRERINAVLARRTRWLTVALEDIYQPHNAAAVLRSCDGFGVQDVHIMENLNTLRLRERGSNVSMGTERWLTLHRKRVLKTAPAETGRAHAATAETAQGLKARGYRIAALTLRGAPVDLVDVPLDKPLALFIGTELTGLSDAAHEAADVTVKLPMEGFAQSFNLSVCTAVCLYELTRRLRDPRGNIPWQLPEAEKRLLYYEWVRRDVLGADELLSRWGA
jgi:tRNA (guanosine-2'-O-)-methyltransferase